VIQGHPHPSDVKRSEVDLAKLMRGESGLLVRAETRFRHKDGSWRTLEVMGTKFLDSAGDATCVLNSRDVTEQRLWEETLRHQALHDGITGLPNRACLRDRLQTLMHTGRRKPKPFALFILDLDSFKEMNDTFGHHCGDDILRQVAYRLQKHIRSADVVARMGGDEFALAVCLDSREDAAAVGGRILDALGPGYEVEGHKLSLSASVGAALFPEHAVGPDNLLRLADMAMYTAKRGGGGRFAIYDIERDSHSRDRIALQGELRDAFEREELRLHFQPFFDSTGKHVLGVEALARWQHPRRGLIMPGDFLETLGQDGLSRVFTAWVLKSALSQCTAWHEEGLDVDMAINLSARDLDDNQLPRLISKLLAENHIDPRRLTVELTEDTVMLEPERSRATLGALREIGVGVALDDFGCGHATFTWLRTLPFSRMKIDRSFVLNMAVQKEDAAIVRSAIGLGHDLGLTVVGEGVENLATMRLLKAFGCDILQGNYLGRPMPAKSAARHIARLSRDEDRETDEPESVLPGALLGAVPRSLPS
ncbi:MAG: EAL domain-containing protein, partial [Actinobacteria bacterium]|nr:EAL domain-containing protein [Actinomycetota bacterium]